MTDPTVATWKALIREYAAHHDHEPCERCDPQVIAEKHIEACDQYLFDLEMDGDEEPIPDPAYYPFDGCLTCIVREVLNAAMPALLHHLARDRSQPASQLLQREWDRQ